MANPLLGSKKLLRDMVKYLAKDAPGGAEFPKAYEKYLALSQVTPSQFIDAIDHALEPTGENLGLSSEEMIELVRRLPNKMLRRSVFKKLSPKDQEAHPELAEALEEAMKVNAALGYEDSDGVFVIQHLLSLPMDEIAKLQQYVTEAAVAAPAPGTSFTSTANVAKYPVPLGAPLRREWWKKKRKKKKK